MSKKPKPARYTDKALIEWVTAFGRVTAANVALQFGLGVKDAARHLFAAEKRGQLARSGGGKGDAFYWTSI